MNENKLQREELMKRIGLNIRVIRTKKNITRSSLCKSLGLSQGSLSNIETGKQNITATSVPLLASLLGCTISEIYELGTLTEGMPKQVLGNMRKTEIENILVEVNKARNMISENKHFDAYHLLVQLIEKLTTTPYAE